MRFLRNPRLEQELKSGAEYKAAMRAAAFEIGKQAAAAAPQLTGHYARSFVVGQVDGEAAVGNKDIAAHLVEFGSANNPPHAPLRRGVKAAGLDLKEAPK